MNGQIANDQITASDSFKNWVPHEARLRNNMAWGANNTQGHWLQVVLNNIKKVTGILTQGKNLAWVTHYQIETSADITAWNYITYESGTPKVLYYSF